jgi:hypothetical protein
MASEPEGTDPQLDTQRIIGERLERVGAKRECPVCDHVSWGVSPGTFALIPIENGKLMVGREFGRASALQAVVCNNCGFVRLHAIDILIR